ncbi:hypothetical protein AB6A40_003543 [Gnathostoma spinigerum]|uniref:Major sperm protein n=1 Tax=Gnathostoma spinigerum TaxID=75299 RepID=A0ABD6EHM3_9BILA
MSKNSQVLIISPPNEIEFHGPFKDLVTSSLRLRNPSNRRVCFKVKTTAPKMYCVKPNCGIIEPGCESTVAVSFVSSDSFLANVELKNAKHKFMILTCFAPQDNFSLDTVWKEVDPSELMDTKLHVRFVQDSAPQEPVSITTSTSSNSAKNQDDECELHHVKEERQKIETEKQRLEKELEELKNQLTALQANYLPPVQMASDLKTLPTIQVGLIVLAAFLFGLIIGKLF